MKIAVATFTIKHLPLPWLWRRRLEIWIFAQQMKPLIRELERMGDLIDQNGDALERLRSV